METYYLPPISGIESCIPINEEPPSGAELLVSEFQLDGEFYDSLSREEFNEHLLEKIKIELIQTLNEYFPERTPKSVYLYNILIEIERVHNAIENCIDGCFTIALKEKETT